MSDQSCFQLYMEPPLLLRVPFSYCPLCAYTLTQLRNKLLFNFRYAGALFEVKDHILLLLDMYAKKYIASIANSQDSLEIVYTIYKYFHLV